MAFSSSGVFLTLLSSVMLWRSEPHPTQPFEEYMMQRPRQHLMPLPAETVNVTEEHLAGSRPFLYKPT